MHFFSTSKRVNVNFPAALLRELKKYIPRRQWNEFIINSVEKELKELAQKEATGATNVGSRFGDRVAYRRLWWVGLLAMVLALVSNTVIYILASLIGISFQIPAQGGAELKFISIGNILTTSVVPALAATVWLGFLGLPFLRQIIRRPLRVFGGTAMVVLLFSLVGPINLPVSTAVKAALILMHGLTALIVTGLLGLVARQRR